MRIYKKDSCITFRSTKSDFGGLSNMAPGYPIKINDNWVKTAEALYQALKYPYNPEIQKRIIFANSPIVAKRISRYYEKFERPDWLNVRYKIMKFCIEVKLKQNINTFSKVLLSTDNLAIVEYTNDDKVWGAIDKGEYYEGINALGRLLMELREKYRDAPNGYFISPPNIANVTFLGIDLKENLNYL
ncbi:NADAR family protein [Mucilaginibacter rigui]|uniref:NADAR family protein n=1 Tax=Mucilaginibacter rigui TaxID=534635 RepID=A0ABR7X172_9SPHI|nr:NADAR family protein [Mucilaginibacter rigui]MBD1383735.1 NADAR family protein [Mucilaginibacter rigui]